MAGSGTAVLTGTSQEADYRVAGSGDLFASDLQANAFRQAYPARETSNATPPDFLKARTSGSGNIGYKGNPNWTSQEGIIQALIPHTLQGAAFRSP
ncbi:MAG: GIN domain-containing protein, partial [Bacteroides stercoris]